MRWGDEIEEEMKKWDGEIGWIEEMVWGSDEDENECPWLLCPKKTTTKTTETPQIKYSIAVV
jgi:hypothetical protein